MFKYYVYIESEVIVLPLVIYAETRETAYKNAVKQFTETFFKHSKDLQYATSLELITDEKTAVSGIDIPFHPGAAAYYKEKDITVKTK